MTARTLEEFLGGRKPPRLTVTITMRADLLARREQLLAEHGRALRDDVSNGSLAGDATAPLIVEELRAIEAEIADSEFPFTFESIGAHRYRRLVAQHPPRKEDRSEGVAFNSDTFPLALIAASCVEPEMDEDGAAQLLDVLSDGQLSKLWAAALKVNLGDDTAPKSVLRSATVAQNGTSSSTAPPEGSLGASS